MGHGITVAKDGRATAAYFQDAAWHRLGNVYETQASFREWLGRANIDALNYQKVPLFAEIAGTLVDTGKFTTVWTDPFTNEQEIVGGYLDENFSLESPEDIVNFIDALVEGGAEIASLGVINNGSRMFVSLKTADIVFGDIDLNAGYILVATGFAGNLATSVRNVSFRVDCSNMLNMALFGARSEYVFTAKHTSPIAGKIMEARISLDMAWKANEAFEKEVAKMVDTDVTSKQFTAIVENFVPLPEDASKAKTTRVEAARGQIHQNYRYGAEILITGTAWGAFNALTDFIDHQAGNKKSDEERALASFLDDRVDAEKKRALTIVKNELQLV